MFVAGINPTQVWASTDTVPFPAGTIGQDHQGRVYQLVQMDATGATGAGYVVAIQGSNTDGDMVETTVSAPGTSQGQRLGIAMAAIAASGFGWLCIFGMNVPVQVLASCALGTRLNTTATAGALDDDATAGSEEACGISLDAARAASQGNANATVTWPYIGKTL